MANTLRLLQDIQAGRLAPLTSEDVETLLTAPWRRVGSLPAILDGATDAEAGTLADLPGTDFTLSVAGRGHAYLMAQ